jgi:hypothetical protein
MTSGLPFSSGPTALRTAGSSGSSQRIDLFAGITRMFCDRHKPPLVMVYSRLLRVMTVSFVTAGLPKIRSILRSKRSDTSSHRKQSYGIHRYGRAPYRCLRLLWSPLFAPKGRRVVATGAGRAAAGTRGKPRFSISSSPAPTGRWNVSCSARLLRPFGAKRGKEKKNIGAPLPTGCAAPSKTRAALHPWLQPCAPPGRRIDHCPRNGSIRAHMSPANASARPRPRSHPARSQNVVVRADVTRP